MTGERTKARRLTRLKAKRITAERKSQTFKRAFDELMEHGQSMVMVHPNGETKHIPRQNWRVWP